MSFSLPFCLTFKTKNVALQIEVICIIYVNLFAGRSVGGSDWCYFCEREDKVGHAGLCRQKGFQGSYNKILLFVSACSHQTCDNTGFPLKTENIQEISGKFSKNADYR
jgi:hypothetical protein